MEAEYSVVIVGAGHAGAQAAILLRQMKYEGSIALFGDERQPPYERPPLSKEYLAGEKPFERMLLRPENFWSERGVELHQGARVASLDMAASSIVLADKREFGFGKLIWAAGGSPRFLSCPGAQASNIFAVRRKSDIDQIRSALPGARRIAVIGGGYIGLETAAVLAKLGKQVTIVEMQNRLLTRVAGEALSRFYEEEHRAHGVDIVLGALVERFETDEKGRAHAAVLDNGTTLETDMVILGIGIVPETGPLIAAGATGGNGVDVDSHCRTSLENVYAVGDCAAHANNFARGTRIRLESVQNANDQARVAAADIAGQPIEYDMLPWFWSNQYDLKLQTVGLTLGYDEEIVRGDPSSRSFSVAYLRDGRLIALDCVNRAKDYVQGRTPISEGAALDRAELADIDIPIKEVSTA